MDNLLKAIAKDAPRADPLQVAADAVDEAISAEARMLAEAGRLPLTACYDRLVTELFRRIKGRTPGVISDADNRAASWRVRVRLYGPGKPDEPEADSDDDLPGDQPGATVIDGLPNVAEHLMALAQGFHKSAPVGLDITTLRHRLKSLRPTLSRRGGNARWRVPYTVAEGDWMATVGIQREAKAHESAE